MKKFVEWDYYRHYKTLEEARAASRELGKCKKQITEMITIDENNEFVTVYELAYNQIF